MFHPNEGQFIDATEDNAYQAKKGTLSVSLLHLGNFFETFEQAFHDHSYSKARIHPVTRTSSHAAYDRFYEHNSSVPEESLRHFSVVEELTGNVKMKVLELVFSELNKSI